MTPKFFVRFSKTRFHIKLSAVFKLLHAYGQTDGWTERPYNALNRDINAPNEKNYSCSVMCGCSVAHFLAAYSNQQEFAFVHLTWKC